MAITFLEQTRYPVGQLLALNEDLSTLMDLSAFLVSADLSFTDELVSQQGTFVLANPKAFFDKLGTGMGAAALTENRLLRYKKGFVDLAGLQCRLCRAHHERQADLHTRPRRDDHRCCLRPAEAVPEAQIHERPVLQHADQPHRAGPRRAVWGQGERPARHQPRSPVLLARVRAVLRHAADRLLPRPVRHSRL